jgi:hypothetical protein
VVVVVEVVEVVEVVVELVVDELDDVSRPLRAEALETDSSVPPPLKSTALPEAPAIASTSAAPTSSRRPLTDPIRPPTVRDVSRTKGSAPRAGSLR